MVYFLNTTVDDTKKVRFALQKIFGLGKKESDDVCDSLGISDEIKISHLSFSQLALLQRRIGESCFIGLELQRKRGKDKERYRRISSYRGIRHAQGLPCRGQRTHTNGKTVRFLSGRYKRKGDSHASQRQRSRL
uniref:Small ribosomal subunit protein uS13m n=1 Tax=Botryococcus braunii TaxID=38881 RepID=A0A0U2EZW4_BOTBR|nr:ribosomal protein S13 [Botryococcus braunii]AKU37092.1 ribosomal protein S13 [Botryococcus braunii]|eukprot:jgi/Botrbrau1/13563/Bobra.4_2s0021.1